MKPYKNSNGFTLVELVTVITILGLLAVAVVPRMASRSPYESRTVEDALINAIRHAQHLAMTKPVGANVTLQTDNANDRIRITYNESGVQTVDIGIASEIDIDDVTMTFDKSGYVSSSTPATPIDIDIDSGSRTVRVEGTGYAHRL